MHRTITHHAAQPRTAGVPLRRLFLWGLVPAVILAGRLAQSAEVTVPTVDGGHWTMAIVPAETRLSSAPPLLLPQQPESGSTAPHAPEANLVAQASTDGTPAGPVIAPQVSDPQPAASAYAGEPPADTDTADPAAPAETHGIHIVPGRAYDRQLGRYRQIYEAIPFSRTEYLANPSYRHDATMELLTGQPRPVTVFRHYTSQVHETEVYTPYATYPPGSLFRMDAWNYPYYRPPIFRYLPPFGYGY